jgi:anaerobic selenocysteine-containing dehydrogenase
MSQEIQNKEETEIYDDVKIHTQCRRCQAECSIIAHRVNGVVVRLEGDPASSIGSQGGLCAKGLSAIQVLYDPNRLSYPLRRTNPEKGIGVDPKWKRISWDEALEEIADKLKKAREKSPSRIVLQAGIVGGTHRTPLFMIPMTMALSTEKEMITRFSPAGAHCGNAGHFINAFNHGAFIILPDLKYCNYWMSFGTNFGFGGFQQFANRLISNARERGMKVVVFDPVCNNAASHADEWVPLLPGTDSAVAIAMLNVIVNELGIYDAEYIKYKTDGPYLIGPDGRFIRDKETKKTMIWDSTSSSAKSYDDSSIGDVALEGNYEVNGIKCRPCWVALKESFKDWSPEKASEISTVPASTIRRIASDFAHAAQIGSTIEIEGKTLPFRPVGTMHIRSAGTHQNGTHALWAIDMLQQVVGAVGVPGGLVTSSVECYGHPSTGYPNTLTQSGPDGMVMRSGRQPLNFPPEGFWPMPIPKKPHHAELGDLFVCSLDAPVISAVDREEVWKKLGIKDEYDIVLNYASNALMNGANPEERAKLYKKIPFIIDIDLFPTEFSEGFADIALPATSPLEMTDWGGIAHYVHNQPPHLDYPWCFPITQAVVPPMFERRDAQDIAFSILKKMGLGHVYINYLNIWLGLKGDEALKPTDKLVWEEVCDKAVTKYFGPEHNWAWFKEHGFISWPKKVEEVYWKCFKKNVRSHIYWEFLIDTGGKIKQILTDAGVGQDMEFRFYSPVPRWYPPPAHKAPPEFDLFAFSWADAMHGNTSTAEQPWVDEASAMNPFTYFINMNADTATIKGLKPGDHVEIESWRGLKVNGVLQVRKAQHPNTLTIMGVTGHWAKGQPIARRKGVHFNSLIELRFSDIDPITASLDPLVKVKVRKIA